MSYETETTILARRVHGRLAKWLGQPVAFLDETAGVINYLTNTERFTVLISYTKGSETYMLTVGDEKLQKINLINVQINAYMVMELFTARRLRNALAVFE